MKCVYTLLLNQSFTRVVTYFTFITCTSLYYFHMWKMNGSIYFRRMFDARLFKPKQTFNRVSPVLDFLWKKWFACIMYVISFYVPTTYICTSSEHVQLFICNYSPFGKHRERLLYVRESDRDTAGSHIFWQHFRTKFEFS